jgi:MFS family permease
MPIAVPIWLLCLLVGVSQSGELIFSAGLPSIACDLNLETKTAQLCSAFYYIGFTIGILFFGRVSDILGRKKSLLIGFTIYTISSLIIVFLDDIYTLIFFRIFQAFGGSAGSIIPQAISRDSYQGRALARVYSTISIVICCIPTIGSTIGGFIVDHSSWRYNTSFLALLGSVMFAICFFMLRETNNPETTDKSARFFGVVRMIFKDKRVLQRCNYSVNSKNTDSQLISLIFSS